MVGSSVFWVLVKLVVTVLQQCCLECLVNPTVRSSLIELKFGRGVVDWFILDLYGGISLWLPESLYGFLLLESIAAKDPLSVSVAILHQFNILPEMYQVGYTKLFFRTGQMVYGMDFLRSHTNLQRRDLSCHFLWFLSRWSPLVVRDRIWVISGSKSPPVSCSVTASSLGTPFCHVDVVTVDGKGL
ncbi:hypothetical protein F2Q70_00042657 [Brassica cretica]|uniref:Uncharacterized protein n=1 Tax=Brassica cretica TaxID=69181 RepID=A0A8S9KFF0_BRACR|nr:hypothetical protein F2Q70_00042657 [Brassica cretica]